MTTNIESDIYDGCDFDAKLEIYWDALDVSEESALSIVPPVFENQTFVAPVTGKHKRDEVFNIFDDQDDGIKAMRFGSLGRIIANSVKASSIVEKTAVIEAVKLTEEHYDELRKGIISKFLKCLNFGDMNGLAKVIRESCCEACFMLSPDLRDPITGKAEVMMLFSLLFEAYPDGVWTVGALNCSHNGSNMISCNYKFTGTRVFNQSVDSLFNQIRAHSVDYQVTENSEEHVNNLHTNNLVNNVAEYCHNGAIVSGTSSNNTSQHNMLPPQHPPTLNLSTGGSGNNGMYRTRSISNGSTHSQVHPQEMTLSQYNSVTSFSNKASPRDSLHSPHTVLHNEHHISTSSMAHVHHEVHFDTGIIDDASQSINIPRRPASIRDLGSLGSLENNVLKNGPVSQKRHMEFFFEEHSTHIIRIVISNI